MPVPADIRAVPRPVNTIVDDSGCDGPKRYAVRERAYTKYVVRGNPSRATARLSDISSITSMSLLQQLLHLFRWFLICCPM